MSCLPTTQATSRQECEDEKPQHSPFFWYRPCTTTPTSIARKAASQASSYHRRTSFHSACTDFSSHQRLSWLMCLWGWITKHLLAEQRQLVAFVAKDDKQNRLTAARTMEGCVDMVLCVSIICGCALSFLGLCEEVIYHHTRFNFSPPPNNKEAGKSGRNASRVSWKSGGWRRTKRSGS